MAYSVVVIKLQNTRIDLRNM